MSNKKEINSYIYGLNYDPCEVIKFNGTKVTNDYKRKEGMIADGKYTVTTRKTCSLEGDIDICVPAGNMNVTYPGGLVCVNSDLVDGKPQAIGAKRSSVVLTLNLPGMTNDGSIKVEEATNAKVSEAINQILNRWYEKYSDKCSIPADMSFTGGIIYDKNEMQLKFGCDVGFLEQKLGIDFNAIKKDEKSVYLVKYKQVFYTASVETFSEPAEAFAEDVTPDVLIHNGVNNQNPPGYIGSVVYGREIYIKFESNCSQNELEAAVSASISVKGVKVTPDAKAKYGNVSKNISCSIVAFGGSPVIYNGIWSDSDTQKEINSVIFDNVVLSQKNPAAPLTYKTLFLKDNKVAKVSGTTQYVEEKVEEYSGGELNINHTGAFVAKFYVNWKEVTGYDANGNEITKDCAWSENGNHKTAGFKTQIPLNGNVRNIHIKAQGATGLAWDKWHTPLDKDNLAMVPQRNVKIWGTTLKQKASCEP